MTLYYLSSLVNKGTAPENMVDPNTRTDYKKIKQLIDIERGTGREKRSSEIMEIAHNGYTNMKLVDSFPALAVTDDNNFRSLIYYYGMLSMESVHGVMQRMIIPNQSVRLQYWEYVKILYSKYYSVNDGLLLNLFYHFAYEGSWEPLMRYLGDVFEQAYSVRDSIGGEHDVQGFIKAYLAMCDYHILCPEIEMGYGYSDFLMVPQLSRFPDARHSYIIEMKYAKPSASKSEIEKLSSEADTQLARYLKDSKLVRMLRDTTVHALKLVFHGPRLVICEQV